MKSLVIVLLVVILSVPVYADIIVVLNRQGVLVTAYKGVTMTQIMQNHPPSAGFRYWTVRDSCRNNKAGGGWNITVDVPKVKAVGDSLHHANVDSVLMYDARINLGSW